MGIFSYSNFNQNVGCTVMLKDVWFKIYASIFFPHMLQIKRGYFNCYIAMKDENLLKDLCLLKEGVLAMMCTSLI